MVGEDVVAVVRGLGEAGGDAGGGLFAGGDVFGEGGHVVFVAGDVEAVVEAIVRDYFAMEVQFSTVDFLEGGVVTGELV